MVPSLHMARQLCTINAEEEALLASTAAPIVLMRKRLPTAIAEGVAPHQRDLGVMLPYTPIHHMLMRRSGFAVVATSGNLSGEPIVTEENSALGYLGHIADAFLVHDRVIAHPTEDSVVRIVLGAPQIIRRGRGYAPLSLALDPSIAGKGLSVLALGGHLKTAATVLHGAEATVGPHVGDLGTLEAERVFVETLDRLERLRGSRADIVACDLHPDYATSRIAERLGRPVVRVQHHLAHVAAVMAEHELDGPVLGIAWDGTGYGPDGSIWGGEFLSVERGAWNRVAHVRPFRLPGSEAAIREPRRSGIGVLYEAFGPDIFTRVDLPPVAAFTSAEREVLHGMLERGVHSPWTTSAGRLFDAFGAILGFTPVATYEGEAATRTRGACGRRIIRDLSLRNHGAARQCGHHRLDTDAQCRAAGPRSEC